MVQWKEDERCLNVKVKVLELSPDLSHAEICGRSAEVHEGEQEMS